MAFIHYSDFKLGDMKLSDFNGVLHNGGKNLTKNLLPKLDIKTKENLSADGSLFNRARYKEIEIELNILIDNEDFDEEEFKDWIKSKEPRWFNYIGDEWKIKVIYDDNLEIEIFNNRQALITLKLIAPSPYWYLINDDVFSKVSPVVGNSYSFNNSGNEISFPLIKITGNSTQDITFELNERKFLLSSVTGEIFIDFYTETVYKFVGGVKVNSIGNFEVINGIYKYDFGGLKAGRNNIKITSGTISSLIVNCNSRKI